MVEIMEDEDRQMPLYVPHSLASAHCIFIPSPTGQVWFLLAVSIADSMGGKYGMGIFFFFDFLFGYACSLVGMMTVWSLRENQN
jgi:hypothetical protein